MKTRFKTTKKLISILLCMALLFSYLPITTMAAVNDAPLYNRVTDANTMDLWRNYFPLEETNDNPLTTENAGGVWTDKSVLTSADDLPDSVTMIDDEKNFLTVLSTIAANKEVVGYSTVPTDTVLILDVSGSMDGEGADLVTATNDAITRLQAINNNNRVGVVLYSGSRTSDLGSSTYSGAVSEFLPIGRYTAPNNQFLVFDEGNNNQADSVEVNSRLKKEGENNNFYNNAPSKNVTGGTYIQAGLWQAWKMFDSVEDVEIGDGNWQKGKHRMPIVVLMSDGAPTLGTSKFDDVENSSYRDGNGTVYASDAGNGNDEGITAGQGFLVQLTASYIKNRIENKYKVHETDGAGRSLFYTLGFNLDGITSDNAKNIALNVLNPDGSTVTDSLWATYNANRSTQVSVKTRNSQTGWNGNVSYTDVTVTRNSYATSKSYVDEYFSASANGLTAAFEDIVEEIILQSRYYPTHLEGGSPDFSGYVTFTDELGDYMEVKHINGILLGDVLFDGHMMASKLADNSEDGLGTVERPTALGDEFIRAVKTRLGIADTIDAQLLVAKAFEAGQLAYNGPDDWSNYIAWYAKADGSYNGFWDENSTEAAPQGSVYKVKSYGFLGETHGSIKNSDMMYMSVQVKQNIETGKQTITWKIPAALVPMITYAVTLQGTNIDYATDINVEVEDKTVAPIRLVYETGLRSDLNPYNITRITGEDNLAADGTTRIFYNNYFNIDGQDHTKHITTLAEFTPNKENERFYYIEDSAVYKAYNGTDADTNPEVEKDAQGNAYILVKNNETLDSQGEYFHRRYIFSSAVTEAPIFFYEKMSVKSIESAVWEPTFTTKTQRVGAYVVEAGTPARELDMYEEFKDPNATGSAEMVFYPYLTEQNDLVYIDMNLGNNGLLSVTPATGIKISKTIDTYQTGTSDLFKFRVTASTSGTFDSWLTALDQTPSGDATSATLTNGVYEFEMRRNQTLWLNLPAGTTYTVEEISTNDDYKIKSVHVNSVAQSTVATGRITQYYIDDIDFVNTAVGEGDLVITKQVVDAAGNIVDVNDNITFTAEVTLTNQRNEALSGTFNTSNGSLVIGNNGKFTVSLKDGESFVVRGLPEETRYTVVETNIPNGFELNAAKSDLSGVIDTASNDQALIVNTYDPTDVTGNEINVNVIKTISGNRTNWLSGESYSFVVARIGASTEVGRITISNTDNEKTKSVSLANETYNAAGTYYYTITEIQGEQGGITYDTAIREFSVTVADADMDGDLEITSVANVANTAVSGRWNVVANFNNIYAPTGYATTTINIKKEINDNRSLSGYQFALYNADPTDPNAEADELIRSQVTDHSGAASIPLTYAANRATIEGATYTYYLAEVNAGQKINNVQYTDKVYRVEVTVIDNGDGTISATNKVFDENNEITAPVTFTNEYIPSTSDYVIISGIKTIDGDRVLNANEFKFKLTRVTANAPMPASDTASNTANGSFVFGAIEFDDNYKGNTFYYEVTELSDNAIGGFSYDGTVYNIAVRVDDDGNNITATTTITVGSENASVEDIIFTNTYDPTDATVNFTGTKQLTGKKMRGNEFAFEISAITAGAPMPANTEVANNDKGAIDFGTITFTKAGRYVYQIAEIDKGDDNISYDKSVYTAVVVVTDNAEGTLFANYTLTKDNMPSTEIFFSNGFTPDSKVYDINLNFGGKKNLIGRDLEAGEFEFKLINAVTGEQIGQTVKNDANGNINFPELTLHSTGTYHYKISEVVGIQKGVTYDPVVYHIVIGVEQIDDEASAEDGQLTIVRNQLYKANIVIDESTDVPTESVQYINITDGGSIIFTNKYEALPQPFVISGTKTLTGRDGKALEAGEFTFNLYHASWNTEEGGWERGDLVEQAQNDENGVFTFNKMERKAEFGYSYIYFVAEDTTANDPSITYDATEFMIKVTSVDNLDGTLTVNYEYTVNGDNKEGISFENLYAPVPSNIEISGTKTLTGRDLEAGEFTFKLYSAKNENGVWVKDRHIQTAANTADGKINFAAIPAEAVGTYVYFVSEDASANDETITYDATEYMVEVTAIDNLDGTMKLVYAYTVNGEPVQEISFENNYNPKAAQIKLGGTKTLTGRALEAGEFTFNLYSAKNENGVWVKDELLEQVTNTADGNIHFTTLAADTVGTYVYFVTEDATKKLANITYDATEYMVEVTATDNLDGTMKLVYEYSADGEAKDGIEFANSYTEPPKTGDTSNLMLWFALLFVSSAGIFGATYFDKKKKA